MCLSKSMSSNHFPKFKLARIRSPRDTTSVKTNEFKDNNSVKSTHSLPPISHSTRVLIPQTHWETTGDRNHFWTQCDFEANPRVCASKHDSRGESKSVRVPSISLRFLLASFMSDTTDSRLYRVPTGPRPQHFRIYITYAPLS